MRRLKILFVLLCGALLCACPMQRFDHVIINKSNEILEVEYEYISLARVNDDSQIRNPAKMPLDEFQNSKSTRDWQTLIADRDYRIEDINREISIEVYETNEIRKELQPGKKIRLRLLPKEVLRVFNDDALGSPGIAKIKLSGEKGQMLMEGFGFQIFHERRTGGLLGNTSGYEIIYH